MAVVILELGDLVGDMEDKESSDSETPLIRARKLEQYVGISKIYPKFMNPTGTHKDKNALKAIHDSNGYIFEFSDDYAEILYKLGNIKALPASALVLTGLVNCAYLNWRV